MKRNMTRWRAELLTAPRKKALPVLSFPCVSLLNIPVSELIASSERQAAGMQAVAREVNSAAAVNLMDLSVEAECFGAQIRVSDSEVPTVVGQLIHDQAEADALAVPPVGAGRSGLYIEAVRQAAAAITDRPVFAGAIGPFSLAGRLFDVSEVMIACYEDPDTVHTVLEKATAFLIDYIRGFKQAGANGLVLAEPVAGLIAPALLAEFSAPYVKRIVDAVQDDGFLLVYHNCGGNTVTAMDAILSTGAALYHFGNAVDMREVLAAVPDDVIVMGNVDPAGVLRMGTPEQVTARTKEIMGQCCGHPNFVISSGCDIPPMTPWENIHAFFNAVESYYDENGVQ